jgi:hypothetical protein
MRKPRIQGTREVSVIIMVWFSSTDRNIDRGVVLKVWILPQAVVSLAKCNARNTASNHACQMLIAVTRRRA